TTAPLTAPPSAAQPPLLRFTGCAQFRQRLVFATLARRGLVITGIRSDDEVPGLKSYEATFLRLLDALTNGARIEINETGTALKYVPGIIVGGVLEHDCGVEKAIGWFIEGLLPLLPFGKKGVALTLTGVTNDDTDFNVDTLRTGVLPVLAHFGLTDGLALNIKRRGALPEGGGCVQLYCPSVRQLIPINLTEEGLVRKVRGISYCSRVSPQMANRLVEGSKYVCACARVRASSHAPTRPHTRPPAHTHTHPRTPLHSRRSVLVAGACC
ncbi:18S rRNA biogenesis protein RCL1, partial [archaeon]